MEEMVDDEDNDSVDRWNDTIWSSIFGDDVVVSCGGATWRVCGNGVGVWQY